jgi:Tfp pilus assembly protein PilE
MTNKRGLSFLAIMIIIAFCALLLRFAIDRIIKFNITQNEATAQATLKLISTALENYARDHLGAFPTNFSVLTQSNPPYIDKNYIAASAVKGYYYSCLRLEPSGYNCTASAAKCGLTGRMSYTISTDGLLLSEECDKKE